MVSIRVNFLICLLLATQMINFKPSMIRESNTTIQDNRSEAWAVIGSVESVPEIKNIYWIMGNQDIPYSRFDPFEIADFEIIKEYSGIIIWTGGDSSFNASAIKLYAKNKPVIADIKDFSLSIYPRLERSLHTVSASTALYVMDWGNFRKNDKVEMHDGDGRLTVIEQVALQAFSNITIIAKVNEAALFHMSGLNEKVGFYVLDLHSTRNNSYESGNWHIFPAISNGVKIKVGQYSSWIINYLSWYSLDWVNDWMDNFAKNNDDIVELRRIGTTVQGRPINALFIGFGDQYFIADAAIHGNEKSGTHTLVRFAELLVEWYRNSSQWAVKLAHYKIILIPVLNPDGYAGNNRLNSNGADLNRQFPPMGITTEPEAWSLRWLMGNYTPTGYASLHSGGNIIPLNVMYPSLSPEPYRTFFKTSLNEGMLSFQEMHHWGSVFGNVPIGSYRLGSFGYDSKSSPEYAFYNYKAISIMPEHWGAPRSNLHFQDFYISAMLAVLTSYDKTDGFMISSNAFISESTYVGGELNLMLNIGSITEGRNSLTEIYDFNDLGKPRAVHIDGEAKTEEDGWIWDEAKKTTKIFNANLTISLDWTKNSTNPNPVTISKFIETYKNHPIKLILPSNSSVKALGCLPARNSDVEAGTMVKVLLKNSTEGLDVRADLVDQSTGRPLGWRGTVMVTVGGPAVNPVLKYLESNSTLENNRVPVYCRWSDDWGEFAFVLKEGREVNGSRLDADLFDHEDVFVIEAYVDSMGRSFLILYGYGWKGTVAAVMYLQSTIYHNLSSSNMSWMVVKWKDSNGDGIVSQPGSGDDFILLGYG